MALRSRQGFVGVTSVRVLLFSKLRYDEQRSGAVRTRQIHHRAERFAGHDESAFDRRIADGQRARQRPAYFSFVL